MKTSLTIFWILFSLELILLIECKMLTNETKGDIDFVIGEKNKCPVLYYKAFLRELNQQRSMRGSTRIVYNDEAIHFAQAWAHEQLDNNTAQTRPKTDCFEQDFYDVLYSADVKSFHFDPVNIFNWWSRATVPHNRKTPIFALKKYKTVGLGCATGRVGGHTVRLVFIADFHTVQFKERDNGAPSEDDYGKCPKLSVGPRKESMCVCEK